MTARRKVRRGDRPLRCAADAGDATSRDARAGLTARAVMRVHPRGVTPDESLAHAARLMDALGTREVPVIAGPALVGILTRTDMEPFRGHFEWTLVQTAMTADPVTVSPYTPIARVMRLLLDRGFNSVPVTAAGKLLGMVARTDVLRALAEPP